jgi:hypothetical protein
MRPLASLLAASLLLAPALSADDGAASIAAGGIILMKREPRITMAKETLRISQTRVVVDYDFRNDSDADITTEVAFPIPAYEFPDESTNLLPNQMGFDDFKLWVDNAPQNFAVETRSFVGKSEVTGLLKGLGIDAASFGHYSKGRSDVGYFSRDIDRLSPSQRTLLVGRGVISSESDRDPVWSANWRVEKKYHWTQIFPAHSVVQIRHQYTPVLGNSNTYQTPELPTVCPSRTLMETLDRKADHTQDLMGLQYVDFILTTANTWKTPIEDFTLIVERPQRPRSRINLVSFCWEGPVVQIDGTHFSAHVSNFIPKKELRIGFIN